MPSVVMQRLDQQPNKLKYIWMWLAVRFEIAEIFTAGLRDSAGKQREVCD